MNWGQKGGHGGIWKGKLELKEEVNKLVIKVGNGGNGGSGGAGINDCNAGSDGGTSSITIGDEVYSATGGKGGSGKKGPTNKDSRASNGTCKPSECTKEGGLPGGIVNFLSIRNTNGASGGGLGDALKGGKGGSKGWVKIKSVSDL